MRRTASFVGLLLVSLLWTGFASAQEVGSLEWFKAEWAAAAKVEIPKNIYIEYVIISPVPGDETELERLRGIVEGKPDHPLKQQYEDLKWQFNNGPQQVRYRLWYGDSKHWRMSRDLHQRTPLQFIDLAVRGGEAWQLTDRDLSLVDAADPPVDRNPANAIRVLPIYLQRWMFPGMAPGTPLGLKPESSEVLGETWKGTIRSATGDRVIELRGRVVDGSVRVDTSTMVQALDEPRWTGSTSRFSDWSYNSLLGRSIARSCTSFDHAGVPWQAEIVNEIRALREGELAGLLTTPTAAGEDSIRGTTTFVAINDFRNGVRTDLREAGSTQTPLPEWTQRKTPPKWLRPSGWILAAGIVVALVWVRLRTRSAGT